MNPLPTSQRSRIPTSLASTLEMLDEYCPKGFWLSDGASSVSPRVFGATISSMIIETDPAIFQRNPTSRGSLISSAAYGFGMISACRVPYNDMTPLIFPATLRLK